MSNVHASANATLIRGGNKSRDYNRDHNRDDSIDYLVEILSQQFSFRESKKVEGKIADARPGYIRPQNEYFQMRKILESARIDGKISSHSANLAINLFARMLSRKLWQDKVVFNRLPKRERLNGVKVNYDQRDLMIISRRVARRILRRRLRRG